MGGVALGFPNRVDIATITASSSAAGCPASNLQTKNLAKVWRSTGVSGAITLDFDFGAAVAVRAFAAIGCNATSSGTFRFTAGASVGSSSAMDSGTLGVVRMPLDPDSLAWGDPAFWEGAGTQWIKGVHPIMYVHPTQVSARYARATFTDATNADGFLQVARAFVGPAIAPAQGDSYGRRSGIDDLTTFALPGARYARQGRKPKRVELSLRWLTAGEARSVRNISRRAGADEDVLYIPNLADAAEQQEYGFLGVVESGLESLSLDVPNEQNARLVLKERL